VLLTLRQFLKALSSFFVGASLFARSRSEVDGVRALKDKSQCPYSPTGWAWTSKDGTCSCEPVDPDLELIICRDCGQPFDAQESLMGPEGQCQLCWESECSRSWWATFTHPRADAQFGREEMGSGKETVVSFPETSATKQ
jgi:hypothetical protein